MTITALCSVGARRVGARRGRGRGGGAGDRAGPVRPRVVLSPSAFFFVQRLGRGFTCAGSRVLWLRKGQDYAAASGVVLQNVYR